MTRWLRAAQVGLSGLTKPTELTEPPQAGPAPKVLSVKSVLSEGGEAVWAAEGRPSRDLVDAWEERAAIREFDGGQSREDAERAAARDLGVSVTKMRDATLHSADPVAWCFTGKDGATRPLSSIRIQGR